MTLFTRAIAALRCIQTTFLCSPRPQEVLVAKPVANSLASAREEEALLYLAVGAAIAFVLSAGVLTSILLLVRQKERVRDREPLLRPAGLPGSRYQDPPQMIYSENFSQGIEREKERLHFTPLDDNFQPIETEVDFVPRYIKEDCARSWESDGSGVEVESNPLDRQHNLSTFGEEVTSVETDRRSQMSRSPFYWSIDSPSPAPAVTPSPVPPPTPSPAPVNGAVKTRKRPPRPPSRTDSLNPNSVTKVRVCYLCYSAMLCTALPRPGPTPRCPRAPGAAPSWRAGDCPCRRPTTSAPAPTRCWPAPPRTRPAPPSPGNK